MNKTEKFNGVFTAIVTPFLPDFSIDYKNLENLIDHQLKARVSGIVVSGTTGESPTLSSKEKQEMLSFVLKKCKGKCVVLAGTGSNDTKKTIDESRQAQEMGADGLLIVTPYYNKPSQAGLENHFKSVANEVRIPILLYNVPGRTGVSLSASTIANLSQVENIIGIKEATGNIAFLSEIKAAVKRNDFVYLSGDDPTFWPFLACGGNGVISVASNLFPKQMVDIWKNYLNKNYSAALEVHESFFEIMSLLFIEPNPVPVKTLLANEKLLHLIVRQPLAEMTADNAERLKKAWNKVKAQVSI